MWGMQDPGECQGHLMSDESRWSQPTLLIDLSGRVMVLRLPQYYLVVESCCTIWEPKTQHACGNQPTNQSINLCSAGHLHLAEMIQIRCCCWSCGNPNLTQAWVTDRPTHPPPDLRPASRSMIKILSDCCSALPSFAFANWHLHHSAPPLLHRCRLAALPSFPIWLPVPLPLPTFASGHSSPHQPTPTAISIVTHTRLLGLSAISFAPIEPEQSRSRRHLLPLDQTFCCCSVARCLLSGALYTNSTTASSLVTHLYYDCQPFGQNNCYAHFTSISQSVSSV